MQILFRLNEAEAAKLASFVKKSGLSRSAFLRAMIGGYMVKEKPDHDFYQSMRELSAIGNRINQLAMKANALGFVDAPLLEEEVKKWLQFRLDIRKKYLEPEKLA